MIVDNHSTWTETSNGSQTHSGTSNMDETDNTTKTVTTTYTPSPLEKIWDDLTQKKVALVNLNMIVDNHDTWTETSNGS